MFKEFSCQHLQTTSFLYVSGWIKSRIWVPSRRCRVWCTLTSQRCRPWSHFHHVCSNGCLVHSARISAQSPWQHSPIRLTISSIMFSSLWGGVQVSGTEASASGDASAHRRMTTARLSPPDIFTFKAALSDFYWLNSYWTEVVFVSWGQIFTLLLALFWSKVTAKQLIANDTQFICAD